jgi:hypothetical protein
LTSLLGLPINLSLRMMWRPAADFGKEWPGSSVA